MTSVGAGRSARPAPRGVGKRRCYFFFNNEQSVRLVQLLIPSEGRIQLCSACVSARLRFVSYSTRVLVRALRRRARPTSTRERRASARAYAIPTCSSRARASPSTPRAAVCAAHPPDSSRVVDEKVKPSPAETATCASQSTTDAPNERTRGTPRGVPTISTCIRVTPTTSRVRFRSARISATAPCVR
jgi:hypothetical protein